MFCMMFAQDIHKLTDFGVVINIFCKKKLMLDIRNSFD